MRTVLGDFFRNARVSSLADLFVFFFSYSLWFKLYAFLLLEKYARRFMVVKHLLYV